MERKGVSERVAQMSPLQIWLWARVASRPPSPKHTCLALWAKSWEGRVTQGEGWASKLLGPRGSSEVVVEVGSPTKEQTEGNVLEALKAGMCEGWQWWETGSWEGLGPPSAYQVLAVVRHFRGRGNRVGDPGLCSAGVRSPDSPVPSRVGMKPQSPPSFHLAALPLHPRLAALQ